MSLDDEGLSNVGEVQVVVELGGSPDLSDFNSSMVWGRMLNEIRLLAVLEPQGDVFENAALVSFNGEMIMGMTLGNQILSNLALGQEGIGRNVLALQIEGFEQGDGHFDLVGAFEFFIVFYGQSPHFFWV